MPAIIVGTNMMTEATIKTYANVVIVFSNKSSCSDTCNVTTSPLLQIIGLDITAKFASFSRFIISLDFFVVYSPNKFLYYIYLFKTVVYCILLFLLFLYISFI